MWGWIKDNVGLLSLGTDIGMMLIWLVYLQVFVISFRRSNRTAIHIGMAAADDADARCLVTNMGTAPVYLLGVTADMECGETVERVLVTDRLELRRDSLSNLRERTTQGPLAPGEARDIGSFRDLAERAALRLGHEIQVENCRSMTLTAVLATQQASDLEGGYKTFDLEWVGDRVVFSSPDVLTRKVRGWRRRRRLRRLLSG